jgi:hypothetical protein
MYIRKYPEVGSRKYFISSLMYHYSLGLEELASQQNF